MFAKQTIKLIFICIALTISANLEADQPKWSLVIHDDLKKPSLKNFSERNYILFQHFINSSLKTSGKQDFQTISKQVKNNIFWKGHKGKNIYIDAFKRSYPIVKNFDKRADIPEIVFLIPYLESLWHSKSGKTSADYGYWQLVRNIVEEIQELPTTPNNIKKAHPDTIRSNPKLSTEVALLHLRRYYFHFAKVAKYSETDAWLFSMLSYNWGAGNVKRMLAEMQKKKIPTNFSSFYHYLYKKHLAHKNNKSMKAAVEYLPSLWNIAKVIRQPT